MLALAAHRDRFAIITVFDADRPAPAWETMFGWPAAGGSAVPLAVRSSTDRNRWAAKLDAAVQAADRAVLLVADGVGCAASAWWARLSPAQDVERVAGALLFAPEREVGMAGRLLFAAPQTSLPFPSLVIQPGAERVDLRGAVDEWGSRVVVGARPRQPRAGAAAWRQAERLFLRLTSHVVEHDVERAEALIGRR